jgi:hypothetical protein
MIDSAVDRFVLAISLPDAVRFAMGWTDLAYDEPDEGLRQVIGLLALDELEYSEEWRSAALLRACLREKWRDSFE